MVIDAKPHEKASATLPGRSELGASDAPAPRRGGLWYGQGPNFAAASCCRVFSVEEVRSVQIDRPQSTAVIRYEPRQARHRRPDAAAGGRAAGHTRGRAGASAPSVSCRRTWRNRRLTIHRHRGLLSTWEVVGDQPGVLCLRHEIMAADSALARRIAHRIESVHGVLSSVVRPLSGTLKIGFDPAQTRTERLLRALESAPDSLPIEIAAGGEPVPVQFGLVNTAIALSVVSDFVVPSVWPATAALLVGTNLRMFRDAASQLGQWSTRLARALHHHRRGHAGHRTVPSLGRDELDVAVLEATVPAAACQRPATAPGRGHPATALRPARVRGRGRGRGPGRAACSRAT